MGLASLLLLACSGDPAAKDSKTPDEVAANEPLSSSDPEPAAASDPEPLAAAQAPKRDDRPLPVGDDYLMSHRDCDALAQAYRRAWLRDERKKLDKMAEKLRAQAAANLDNAANQGAESWLTSCQGIVGSPQVRTNLKCALKAKSLERFEACMAGQVESTR